jgi:hypothetical protein
MRGIVQAEYGDDAVKQLRQREAEERRAARTAREQGEIDVNQIPLGEKVHTQRLRAWNQQESSCMMCHALLLYRLQPLHLLA